MFNHCIGILSNLSAQSPNVRKEIFKFKPFEVLARAFDVSMIQTSVGTLRNIALFIRNLTLVFNTSHLKDDVQGVIVGAMIDMIHLDDEETELYIAETFQQILEMPNKESFLDAIIKHELTCNVGIGEKSFWHWIC